MTKLDLKNEGQASEARDSNRRVITVGGRLYYFISPRHTPWFLLIAPLLVYFITDDVAHLYSIVMVFLGISGANPRFSPVQGCLAWIPIVAVLIIWAGNDSLGIPLASWGAVAWLIASIETRIIKEPYGVIPPFSTDD